MNREIADIISRFLGGESSAEDQLLLSNWLEEKSENLEEFAEIERRWNAFEILSKRQQFDPVKAFNKFKSYTREQAKTKTRKPVTLKSLIRNSARWAAIGIILATLGSITTYLVVDHNNKQRIKIYEVKVPAGSRSNITLADGTTVWLNAGSRLTYAQNFGIDGRTVNLEGEGYFNVAKEAGAPFTVITTQLEITALGTSFNVKSYPEEDIIQTTLVSGSLLVSRSKYKEQEKGVVLEPNQQITYYTDSRQFLFTHEKDDEPGAEKTFQDAAERTSEPALPKIILSRGIDPEIFTAWKDNRLIFDDEPLESIAVKLERRFGASIIIKDENIKKKRFKGRFDEITIEQALSALKFASPFEFRIKHDTIYITSQ